MTSAHLGRRTTSALALTALVTAGLVTAPAHAAAGDLVVTNTNDSGEGSLREALALAAASPEDDRITFAPGVRGTITLTSGQLEATVGGGSGDLVVEGPGADQLTLDAQHRSRVLDVQGTTGAVAAADLSGLALVHGRPTDFDANGGALRARDVAMSLTGVSVSGNASAFYSQVPRFGGGISVTSSDEGSGSLTLTDSLVMGNSAAVHGGGVYASSGVPVLLVDSLVRDNTAASQVTGMEVFIQYGDGGGIYADDVTLVDSTVADNVAQLAGGGLDVRSLEMRGSTVSGNSAMTVGGGIRLRGGDQPGSMRVTSSTVTSNFARRGGAVGSTSATDSLELTLTTVVDNAAMSGGGVDTPGSVLLRGSVLGMNAGGDLAGGGSAVTERSLVQEPRDFTVGGAPVTGQDPVVGTLAEAGGSTSTMLPASNSPLVDAGASYGTTTDQRGSSRPTDDPRAPDVADGSDVGAVELTTTELVGPAQVVSLERPSVAGTARVGEVLRARGGTWSSDDVDLGYQWLRNGVPIEGATGRTYRVSGVDRGTALYGGDERNVLSVRVTAAATGLRAGVAESDTTGFVVKGPFFQMDGAPKVEGSTKVGSILRARPRVAAVSPRPETVNIQWVVGSRSYPRREGDRRFTLTRAMRGGDVRVVFTYTSGPDELVEVVAKPRPVH